MMRTSDRLISPSRGTLQQAQTYAARFRFPNADKDVNDYLVEVFRLAPLVGIDPSIVVAQSCEETTAWSSPRWVVNHNPSGLGISQPGDPDPATFTGTEAARVHLWALLIATGAPDASVATPLLPVSAFGFCSRWLAKYADPNCPTVVTIDDLNIRYTDQSGEPQSTWAWDAAYQDAICERGNAIFPSLPDQGGTVTQFTTNVPGLPGGPLVTDYPIHTTLIPSSNTRQRPGLTATTPRRSVQHGTGNPNSLAAGDAQWILNGADGAQLSVHFECDDTEVFCLVPVNEVTWQAADGWGPGNMQGLSCEMTENANVWNDAAQRDRAIHVAADLMGRCAARLGIHAPERHWDFNWGECCDGPCDTQCGNRHHCPDKLMSTGLWETAYAPRWNAARIDELRRMGGGTTTTTTTAPPYATPRPMPMWDGSDKAPPTPNTYGETWQAVRRQVTATRDCARLQAFDTKGPRVGPDIPKGTSFGILWLVKTAKGNYAVTEHGTVVGVGGLTPQILIRNRG